MKIRFSLIFEAQQFWAIPLKISLHATETVHVFFFFS